VIMLSLVGSIAGLAIPPGPRSGSYRFCGSSELTVV
jgi:hypothetical protein